MNALYNTHARQHGHVVFWEYKTYDTPTCIEKATFIDARKCRKIERDNCGDTVVRLEVNENRMLVKCPKVQKHRSTTGKYIFQRLWGASQICRDKCVWNTIYLGMDEKEDDFNRRLEQESCYDGIGHRLVCDTKRRVLNEVGKYDLGLDTY